MEAIATKIIEAFERGNRCFIFGNGGSLTDASHFAAEFNKIGPVIALTDAAKITSIGNDYGFKYIFSIQLEDLVNAGDLVIGLSSSGKSQNVILALATARSLNCEVIDFPRKGKDTQEVQNYQYQLLHRIYQYVLNNYDN